MFQPNLKSGTSEFPKITIKTAEGEQKHTSHMFRFDSIAVLAASIKNDYIFNIFFSYSLDILVHVPSHTNRIK